jgi:hypothetical protein
MNGTVQSSFLLADLPVQPPILIGGIIAAILIVIIAIFLIRGGSKQKESTPSSPSDWQSQPQGGMAPTWSQQSQQGANAWNPQQPGGAWGNQQPATTAANPWGTQQQQPGANPWGAPQQSTGSPWDNQQQQSAANPWAASQQQQPSANPWATPQQQSGNSWDNQQQQPSANPWAASQQQQPAANPWGAQAPTAAAQESWNQPQQPWGQNASSTPSSGGPASGPAWGKPAQQDSWGGVAQPSPFSPPSNQSWPQQGGFGQQGSMGGGFTPPDNDKTVLRPGGSSVGIGYVRVEEGKEPGRTYEVRKEALSIGRSRESDIFLEDLAVSRLHASIVNLGNGNYALKDEGSANGTKVNGQLVNKFQTHPLQEGDRIQLGQTVLVFAQR